MGWDTHVADIIEGVEFGRETTVNTEELFVHDSGERECAERIHARVVYPLGVLALAYSNARYRMSDG